MKRSLNILLALMLLAGVSYSQSASAPAGAGTKADSYKIATLNNLFWMEENVNGWYQFFDGKYLLQTADIDASSTSTWNGGQGWKPVGDSLNFHFKGNYDGGGHTISNLYINRPTTNCNGLFGYAELGSIRNLKLSNVNITGQHGTGALIGISLVPIAGCSATGTVKGGKYSAGLVSINNGSIDTCFSSCTVVGTNESGGLVGASTTSINQCYSTGAVSGLLKIGGFIGSNGGTINDCYATGTVSRLSGATATSFYNFAGYSEYYTFNSYATGKVIYIGATSPTTRGFGSYCSGCFFDKETSLQATGSCATATTTAVMQQASTFASAHWDFKGDGTKGIWNIGNARNGGYPYLNWQYPNYPTPILNIAASVTMSVINYNGSDTARAVANIAGLGSPTATDYGFCWATNNNPRITDTRLSLSKPSAKGDYSARITGLKLGVSYYIRPYIINIIDTVYGTALLVKTFPIPTGTGTQADPYLITSLGDLFWMYMQTSETYTKLAGKYFLQTKDINASATATWNNGYGWQSIGENSYRFAGNYNGAHHSIGSLAGSCLFGETQGASIKNLRITNCNIKGSTNTGALVGGAYSNSSIDSCSAQGLVQGNDYTGGLIGYAYSSTIAHSWFKGKVTGATYTGGLLGCMGSSQGLLYRCSANAEVLGTGTVGGLVGAQQYADSYINESFCEGSVSGTANIGGFIGSCANVSNSYSRSTVVRLSGTATTVGGFVGLLSSIKLINCYATGSITYSGNINPNDKGFSGTTITYSAGQRFFNSFWDTQTSGQLSDVGLAEGKNTSAMNYIGTFLAACWDFTNLGKTGVWNIGNAHKWLPLLELAISCRATGSKQSSCQHIDT